MMGFGQKPGLIMFCRFLAIMLLTQTREQILTIELSLQLIVALVSVGIVLSVTGSLVTHDMVYLKHMMCYHRNSVKLYKQYICHIIALSSLSSISKIYIC